MWVLPFTLVLTFFFNLKHQMSDRVPECLKDYFHVSCSRAFRVSQTAPCTSRCHTRLIRGPRKAPLIHEPRPSLPWPPSASTASTGGDTGTCRPHGQPGVLRCLRAQETRLCAGAGEPRVRAAGWPGQAPGRALVLPSRLQALGLQRQWTDPSPLTPVSSGSAQAAPPPRESSVGHFSDRIRCPD